MNTLSHGFLFLCGMTWLLCEVCISASNGNWTPLWLYLAGFCVMFSVMGCWPMTDSKINKAGPIFTIIIGAGIVGYAISSLDASVLGALVRFIGGGAMVALGVISFLGAKGEKEAAH